ncbi:hypothetical protein [Litchfieldella xinjiangensis]|uniref:hypothetical protein n=1 Tax=Litchfieldella xinjiangensis TaxID=1166948 RepID=UPI0005BB3803|nr:hypothetical protein [Halomonas xinjiangensis]
MKKMLQVISVFMLILTALFPMLFLFDVMSEAAMKWSVLATTIVWFLVTPLWMGREASVE